MKRRKAVSQTPKKANAPSIGQINRMLADGKSVIDIANKYGISRQRVYQIINANKDVAVTDKTITKVKRGAGHGEHRVVDPETGLVVQNLGHNAMVIGRMGDEKVSAFVAYHIAMTEMRQGVDKRNVDDLRARFYNYLKYCMEHGIMPNNMNCYYAIGVTKQEMSQWRLGQRATPEHQQFAEEVTALFASIHEQAGAEQIVNPILSIYWSKAYDGLTDQPRNEEAVEDPLGQKRSAEEIASKYSDLPD